MAKILMHPSAVRTVAPTAAPSRTEDADAFLATCHERLGNNHAARGFTPGYTKGCRESLGRLLHWSTKTLVELTPAIYEAWCAALGARGIKRSTQRTYQSRVRQTIQYLHAQIDLQNDAERLFGQRMALFAHRGNSLVHKLKDETEGRRRPMSYEEVDRFFEALDREIEHAEIHQPRRLRDLQRDKALFFFMYVQGVRVDEVSECQIGDWSKSHTLPEAGKYARFRVRQGKGTKGSGKRSRTILLSDIRLANVMAWYERDIRPLYTPKPGHERAWFFSERGMRLSARSVQARMAENVARAGLQGLDFTPHTMRRNMVSHESARGGVEFAREKSGHQDTATTMIYGQVPFEHLERRANRLVRQQIRDLQTDDVSDDA